MPIHINLLAEAKIAENLRRRDPVKLAIYVGVFLIVLTMVWWSSLLLAVKVENNAQSQTQAEIDMRKDAWQEALDSQKKMADAKSKLDLLQKLTQARFLQGNFLNALQQLNIDGVQLTRIKLDQSYFNVPQTSNSTNNNHVILGHPATTTEKIIMTLSARDSSPSPGDQVNKFKDAIVGLPYFKGLLNKTNAIQLTSLSPAQTGPNGLPYVVFTVESIFADKTK